MWLACQIADTPAIDLFYAPAQPYQLAVHELRQLALEAGVKLHVLVEARDGRLTTQKICETVPDWATSDVWFCGPTGFGEALKQDFKARGLPSVNFHEELFDLR